MQGDRAAEAVAEEPHPPRVHGRVLTQPGQRRQVVLDEGAEQRPAAQRECQGEHGGLVAPGQVRGGQHPVQTVVQGEGDQPGAGEPLGDVAVRVVGRMCAGDLFQDRAPPGETSTAPRGAVRSAGTSRVARMPVRPVEANS